MGETTHWLGAATAEAPCLPSPRQPRGPISRFVEEANFDRHPFRWSNNPDSIVGVVGREHQTQNSTHRIFQFYHIDLFAHAATD
jgi:hypothetical protein